MQKPPSGGFCIFATMVNAVRVYNALKHLANKEQKGFITPEVFNSFADIAQTNIIREMFRELAIANGKATGGADTPRRLSERDGIKEDLGRFISIRNLYAEPVNSYVQDSGVFVIPQDCKQIINIKTQGGASVDLIYDVEKMNRLTASDLSSPSETFPAALVTDVIELSPSTVNNITLTYYRNPPTSPQVFSPGTGDIITSGLDFDLPEDYFSEIVYEVAKLIGVRLRDQNIQAAASQEEAKQ